MRRSTDINPSNDKIWQKSMSAQRSVRSVSTLSLIPAMPSRFPAAQAKEIKDTVQQNVHGGLDEVMHEKLANDGEAISGETAKPTHRVTANRVSV